jgi:hypothetical protein
MLLNDVLMPHLHFALTLCLYIIYILKHNHMLSSVIITPSDKIIIVIVNASFLRPILPSSLLPPTFILPCVASICHTEIPRISYAYYRAFFLLNVNYFSLFQMLFDQKTVIPQMKDLSVFFIFAKPSFLPPPASCPKCD